MTSRQEARTIPVPPFTGTRVETVSLDEVLPWLHRPALFRGRWGYPVGKGAGSRAPVTGKRSAEAVLEGLIIRCRNEPLLQLQSVHGYFRCAAEGEVLVVAGPDGEERFCFRREAGEPRRCLADYFLSAEQGGDLLALQLVTTGPGVPRELERSNREHRYLEMLHLHGFASALAEAMAEWRHHRIRTELQLAGEESGDPEDAFRHRYRGRRFSFGYPACPDLEEQATLFRLLQPERIGVTLSPRFQMVPEHSTSALVLHHPEARHFAV